jgi:hypothetical protein
VLTFFNHITVCKCLSTRGPRSFRWNRQGGTLVTFVFLLLFLLHFHGGCHRGSAAAILLLPAATPHPVDHIWSTPICSQLNCVFLYIVLFITYDSFKNVFMQQSCATDFNLPPIHFHSHIEPYSLLPRHVFLRTAQSINRMSS